MANCMKFLLELPISDKRLNFSSWPLQNLQRELEGISLAIKSLQEREMRFAGIVECYF